MSGNFKSREKWLQDLTKYERANRHFATPKDGYPGTGAYVHDMISGGAKDDGTTSDAQGIAPRGIKNMSVKHLADKDRE